MAILTEKSIHIVLVLLLWTVAEGQAGVINGEDSSILVLYSSQTDFGSRAVAELNRKFLTGANHHNLSLEFVDLNTSNCIYPFGNALMAIVKNLFYKRTLNIVGIVGISCSSSSYAVAQLIQHSGIAVKYIYTSFLPASLAAEVNGSSLGLLPPVDHLADASVALIKHANWSEVLAIYQVQDTDMNHIFTHFQSLLRDSDHKSSMNHSTLNYTSLLQDVEIHRFRQLFDRIPIRVLFLMLDAKLARKVMCIAYNLFATYPRYQWVIVKTTMTDILMVEEKHNNSSLTCSNEELLKVFQDVIFINFQMELDMETRNLDSVPLSTQYVYEKSISAMQDVLTDETASAPLSNNGTQITSSTVTSSPSNGELPVIVAIKQMKTSELVLYLLYRSQQSSLEVVLQNISFISSDLIPKDINFFNLQTGSILISVNALLLIICLILHIMMLVYRKKLSAKISIPASLLHVLYVGIYLLNITTTLYCIQKTFISSDIVYINICRLFYFGLPTGLVLITGTVFVKTWRLYRIFVHYRDPGKFLSNYSLIIFVACLSSVNIVICFFWFALDPFEKIHREVNHDIFNKTAFSEMLCTSKGQVWWLLIEGGYSAAIIVGILVLLYKLRHKIPKHYEHLQSSSVVRFGYTLIWDFLFGVPIFILARHVLYDYWLEAIIVSTFMEYIQVSCIVFLLIPALLPMLRTKIHDYSSVFLRTINHSV